MKITPLWRHPLFWSLIAVQVGALTLLLWFANQVGREVAKCSPALVKSGDTTRVTLGCK